MKKSRYITPFVFITAYFHLFVSTPATADTALFEKLDLDGDGQITIKEAVSNLALLASFGKIDTDGNGKISPTELANTKVNLTNK